MTGSALLVGDWVWVCELTGMLAPRTLADYPSGMWVIVRRETPGACP